MVEIQLLCPRNHDYSLAKEDNMSDVDPRRLFGVEGMVAVITGGATGEYYQLAWPNDFID